MDVPAGDVKGKGRFTPAFLLFGPVARAQRSAASTPDSKKPALSDRLHASDVSDDQPMTGQFGARPKRTSTRLPRRSRPLHLDRAAACVVDARAAYAHALGLVQRAVFGADARPVEAFAASVAAAVATVATTRCRGNLRGPDRNCPAAESSDHRHRASVPVPGRSRARRKRHGTHADECRQGSMDDEFIHSGYLCVFGTTRGQAEGSSLSGK